METQEFIPLDIFCRQHGVELTVISSLHEFGLIEVTRVNETACIPVNELIKAEKLLRLYGELQINLEGIDAITHLLAQLNQMKAEIQQLKNRLRFYEG